MRRTLKALAAAVVASGLWASGAVAGPIADGGLTAKEVARWLQDQGYKAELKVGESGKPYVRSAAEGVSFSIYLYDCKAGDRCASLQFSASFDLDKPMDLKVVNAWNRDKRFLKAYLDDEGDPFVEYDASVSPGGSYEALNDDFLVWTSTLPAFKSHIGW